MSGDEVSPEEDPLQLLASRDFEETVLEEEVVIRLHDDLRPARPFNVPWQRITLAVAVAGSGSLYVAGWGILSLIPSVTGLIVTVLLADAERREGTDVPPARIEVQLESRGLALQRFGVTRFVPWSELLSFDVVERPMRGVVGGMELVQIVVARTRSRGAIDLLVFRDQPSAWFVHGKLLEHWERLRRHTAISGYR